MLLFVLPFEMIRPVITFEWFAITNLEMVFGLATLGWVWVEIRSWRAGEWQIGEMGDWRLGGAVFIFLICVLVSALLTPEFRLEAMKAAGRMWLGGIMWLMIGRSELNKRTLLWAIVLGAGASGLLGLLEAGGLTGVWDAFKLRQTYVGNQLRVSGSFQYATIAAMFWEMAVPLAIGLAATEKGRPGRVIALLIALICTVASLLTLTRSGMLALGVVLVGLVVFSFQFLVFSFQFLGLGDRGAGIGKGTPHTLHATRYTPLLFPAGLTLIVFIMILGFLTLRSDFQQRLTTEIDEGWYGATYGVPSELTIADRAGETVSIQLTNSGEITWLAEDEKPFILRYRWATEDGSAVYAVPAGEVSLPYDVSAGESVELEVEVVAGVPAGTYQLLWGMVHLGQLPFYARGVPEAETMVTITAEASDVSTLPQTIARTEFDQNPQPYEAVTRRDQWKAAIEMGQERPLFGYGPNSYRLRYGPYLDIPDWDRRANANSLYFELLADLGAVGLVAFGVMVGVSGRELWRKVFNFAKVGNFLLLGLSTSLLTFFIHGLLDYFFEFLPVYLLFWSLLGMIAQRNAPET